MARSIAAVLLLLVAGCGAGRHHAAMVVRSPEPRAAPVAPGEDLRAVAAGNDAFAARLYAVLARDKGTFAFSPYSISVALAMTSAGARGATLAELEHGMAFTLPQPRMHSAFNALDQALEGRQGDDVRLDVANSLWGQEGTTFERPFLDTLARAYGAGMQVVDYRRDPEAARRAINAWVDDRTHGKISKLLAPGSVSDITRLALINAVYFKARWELPFEPGKTANGSFHAPGGQVRADFMNETSLFRYAHGDGFQAIELPYRGDKIAMDVILPDPGKLGAVEQRLTSAGLGPLVEGLAPTSVGLALPKLDFASRFELEPALRALGVHLLFTDRADLSGITHDEPLAVSQIAHQATLTVDERGTEAAAATGVVAVATSMPAPPSVVMTVDRPFILAVRDRGSGQILFLARVLNPADRS